MTFSPDACLRAATEAFEAWRTSSRFARRGLLEASLRAYRAAEDDLARLITEETGKPITLARGEVARGAATLQATLEAVAAFGEEAVPYDLMASAEGCRATLRRFPRGVVLAITPFNFPVNLALHKLAPALGAGCSVVWKPCPQAPETSRRLWAAFDAARREVGAPALIQMAQVEPEAAEALARDDRTAVVSFTGSERVGLRLKTLLAGKPLTLELGGKAAVVLDSGIDAVAAARALAPAAVAGAGQSCSKAQRFYVHQELWDAFVPAFVEALKALPVGDPFDPATLVGPLIDEAQAQRMEQALEAALARGARALLRGERRGRLLPPALLMGVEELDALADAFQQTIRRYDGLFAMRFPYVLSILQAPVDGGDYRDYHLHLMLQPPLRQPGLQKFLAGPEIGGGNFMADTMPEEKAGGLRRVDLSHYVEAD